MPAVQLTKRDRETLLYALKLAIRDWAAAIDEGDPDTHRPPDPDNDECRREIQEFERLVEKLRAAK